jgi:hypothetical protein
MPLGDYTTTVTSGGTTTLTVDSTRKQFFTGTGGTIVLPVVSTLPDVGFDYLLVNNSSGNLTVNSSGGNLVVSIPPGQNVIVTCVLITGTTAASWNDNSTNVFDNILMNNGANIGFAPPSGAYFTIGLSTDNPIGNYLSFTDGGYVALTHQSSGQSAIFDVSILTSARVVVFPNKSGTLVLTDDGTVGLDDLDQEMTARVNLAVLQ